MGWTGAILIFVVVSLTCVLAGLAINPIAKWLVAAEERRMFFVGGVLAVAFLIWQVRDVPIDDRILSRLESDALVVLGLRVLGTWGVGVFIAYALLPFSRWYVGERRSDERYFPRAPERGQAPLLAIDFPEITNDAPTVPQARQVRTVRFTDGRFVLEILAFDSSLMSRVRQVPSCTYDAANRSYSLPATGQAAIALGALSVDVEVFWTREASGHASDFAADPDGPTS